MDSSYNKISLLVYFISFFFQVFSNADLRGYEAFAFGFNGIYFFHLVVMLPWLANFTFAFSILAPTGGYTRFILALVTVIFACFLFFFTGRPKAIMDNDSEPLYYGIGYMLWLSAFAINFIGSTKDLMAANKNARRKTHGIF